VQWPGKQPPAKAGNLQPRKGKRRHDHDSNAKPSDRCTAPGVDWQDDRDTVRGLMDYQNMGDSMKIKSTVNYGSGGAGAGAEFGVNLDGSTEEERDSLRALCTIGREVVIVAENHYETLKRDSETQSSTEADERLALFEALPTDAESRNLLELASTGDPGHRVEVITAVRFRQLLDLETQSKLYRHNSGELGRLTKWVVGQPWGVWGRGTVDEVIKHIDSLTAKVEQAKRDSETRSSTEADAIAFTALDRCADTFIGSVRDTIRRYARKTYGPEEDPQAVGSEMLVKLNEANSVSETMDVAREYLKRYEEATR